MKYRVFPQNHEIKVSEVGFGVWSVATKWWGVTDESFGISLLRYGLDNGINFFDTADVYGNGYGEEIINKAFNGSRHEIVLATKFAKKVTIIHRRDKLRASKIMEDRARSNSKIEFILNHSPLEFLGSADKGLNGIKIKNIITSEITKIQSDGAFIAIGHNPNTQIFKNSIEIDTNGYINTLEKSSMTNLKGVFACGDVQDSVYRQAITAAGSGCMAAIDAERFLEENE